jgi:alpha,alpha-trehalose phosphorylase
MPLLSFEDAQMKQNEAVSRIWNHVHLDLQDESINSALTYHMYQLYVSGAVSDEVSIAAKGLSGEGYEGHYFWDTEMYMLPYFVMHHPNKARHILKHRLIHLEKARVEARQLGVMEGAKIPWRSMDGHELSPYFPAGSAQLHINSDIAYGFILYTETTGDHTLLKEGGFELLIELALYILHYGEMRADGFHIPLVTGPDEYTPLVHDNYYTNKMAKMHFSYLYRHYQALNSSGVLSHALKEI